ncbi:related to NUDIX family hydrolase [Phialocephala subalpina]|uniref:Related to NUDIX family hydrolase n=1 Tax=Phialocephala subalpina TaxID=576137 RepID=A0A1L7WRW8_9HELO|nr:related to NUDIX family hydrolase [Phialocephala subalpina]
MHPRQLRCIITLRTSYTSNAAPITFSKSTIRSLRIIPSSQSPTLSRTSRTQPLLLSLRRVFPPSMAPRPALEKQYMSSGTKPTKQIAEPRPSASILLISPTNEILLLHRVRTSTSFASAHVFPGGNLSSTQDGDIPSPTSPNRHLDGRPYRLGAIRECFEESGILLAKRKDGGGELLDVEEEVREKGRKDVHAGRVRFEDWVESMGGVVDVDGLIPFTRWITPTNLPKRFTTQMYIYFFPLAQTSKSTTLPSKSVMPVPTSDGGVEHTAALFASCSEWLSQARRNEVILFPPQYYLMSLLSPFLSPSRFLDAEELQAQRDKVLEFLKGDGGDGKGIPWADKAMSPIGIMMRKSDGRSVLGLEKPGPELKGSGRGGDEKRVVLVKFGKEGPRDVEVREKAEILAEEKAFIQKEGEAKL